MDSERKKRLCLVVHQQFGPVEYVKIQGLWIMLCPSTKQSTSKYSAMLLWQNVKHYQMGVAHDKAMVCFCVLLHATVPLLWLKINTDDENVCLHQLSQVFSTWVSGFDELSMFLFLFLCLFQCKSLLFVVHHVCLLIFHWEKTS